MNTRWLLNVLPAVSLFFKLSSDFPLFFFLKRNMHFTQLRFPASTTVRVWIRFQQLRTVGENIGSGNYYVCQHFMNCFSFVLSFSRFVNSLPNNKIIPPQTNFRGRGYTGVILSVCPSVRGSQNLVQGIASKEFKLVTSNFVHRSHCGEVQCTRTITLFELFLELLPHVNFNFGFLSGA